MSFNPTTFAKPEFLDHLKTSKTGKLPFGVKGGPTEFVCRMKEKASEPSPSASACGMAASKKNTPPLLAG